MMEKVNKHIGKSSERYFNGKTRYLRASSQKPNFGISSLLFRKVQSFH